MTDLIKAAAAFLEEVHRPRPSRYIHLPFPCELDTRVQSLIEAYRAATEAERAEARPVLCDEDASYCLLSFGKRSAIQAVRRSSEPFLFDGLTAIIIEGLRADYRETTMLMSVMINAAVRIGVDPLALIGRAVTFATPDIAEQLVAIGKKYQDTKNSSLMGYTEGHTSEGFTYF